MNEFQPDDIYSHCVLGFMTIYGPLKIDINMSIDHDYILKVKMQVIDVNFQ